jgi:hypothetical protein
LGRVINPDRAGAERNRLTKLIARANRRLIRQTEINDETRDLAAFTALSLEALAGTIDPTVEAWEKRGYWLKADRYRMDWAWADMHGKKMHAALLTEDWATVANSAAVVAEKLSKVVEGKRASKDIPWMGAYNKLRQSSRTGIIE